LPKSEQIAINHQLTAIEIQELRQEVRNTISAICYYDDYDQYGNYTEEQAFEVSYAVDDISIVTIKNDFEKMEMILNDNILETEVNSAMFFDIKFNYSHKVDIDKYHKLHTLYKKIKIEYCEYLEQFLKIVCRYINERKERTPLIRPVVDDSLPF
jgi:hypothetical protein